MACCTIAAQRPAGPIMGEYVGSSFAFEMQMAGVTGLEPATSGVTGQRSNQLSYTPKPAHCAQLRRRYVLALRRAVNTL